MRLIDADELLKLIVEHSYLLCDYHNSKDKGMFLCGIRQAIDETPTIDAVEQKHGQWIPLEEEIGLYCCSVCGHRIMREACNYCPHCGAKMDEVSK